MYRVLDSDEEEFLPILTVNPGCRVTPNPEAELFICWHKDDVKKWAKILNEKCPNGN